MNATRPNETATLPVDPVEPSVCKAYVVADWSTLTFAFCDDTACVRWYLNTHNGEILCVSEEQAILTRLESDPGLLPIHRARSRDQYRWMEKFIQTVEDRAFATLLSRAITGRQAFQRFRALLAERPELRREWFAFRSEQLTNHVRAWLDIHQIRVIDAAEPQSAPPGFAGPWYYDPLARFARAVSGLDPVDLEAVLALGEHLRSAGTAEPEDEP